MSGLVEVKTPELVGPALDWAIAQIEGVEVAIAAPQYGTGWRVYKPNFGGKYSPSTDWAVGGPLLGSHRIDMTVEREGLIWAYVTDIDGAPVMSGEVYGSFGPTHLIAACRAIIAAKLGDTVQVPTELLTPANE